MYNQQVTVPLVIRAPMGGRRGYGPTHSQTLEKHFLGVPGLRVLAPCTLGDPGELLREAILHTMDPVLFVENKLLYLLHVLDQARLSDFNLRQERDGTQSAITYALSIHGAPPPQITLGAYGYMAELARQAALKLAYEHEIFVEVLVPTQLAPFTLDPLLESVDRTGRLLVIEEGSLSLGWGAEVLAQAAEVFGTRLESAQRLGAQDSPVPASGPLEKAVLPNLEDIIKAARKMV